MRVGGEECALEGVKIWPEKEPKGKVDARNDCAQNLITLAMYKVWEINFSNDESRFFFQLIC